MGILVVGVVLANSITFVSLCFSVNWCNSLPSWYVALSEHKHQLSLSCPPLVLFKSVCRVANPIHHCPACCILTSKYDLDCTNGAVVRQQPDPQALVPPFITTTSWPFIWKVKLIN